MRKITSFLILVSFIFSCVTPPQGFAQTLSAVGLMPQPGTQVTLSGAFTPAILKGMVINPNDPFQFDFIIDRGDESLSNDQKQVEYKKLAKYFLASLAVPDKDQWVNLSPYEKDRIVPDNFGLTEMGRDLLAQDYLLKQISSSLINPDTDLGKKFWDGVYAQAYEKFGTTGILADTFNKVWITPDKADIYEHGNTAYILDSHLKVMMEKDYLATKENATGAETTQEDEAAVISHKVMKEIIIPSIEKEVNEGKNFAPLRQVFSGMILSTWYKKALKESILGKLYADKSKVKGIDQDPASNQEIYGQYVEAFKKGVFNMIKEDTDAYTKEVVPRKYFSGGFDNNIDKFMNTYSELLSSQQLEIEEIKENGDVVSIKVMNNGMGTAAFNKLFKDLGLPEGKVTEIKDDQGNVIGMQIDNSEKIKAITAEIKQKLAELKDMIITLSKGREMKALLKDIIARIKDRQKYNQEFLTSGEDSAKTFIKWKLGKLSEEPFDHLVWHNFNPSWDVDRVIRGYTIYKYNQADVNEAINYLENSVQPENEQIEGDLTEFKKVFDKLTKPEKKEVLMWGFFCRQCGAFSMSAQRSFKIF
jgi:hypothetical protein